jgi:hypothetical protein
MAIEIEVRDAVSGWWPETDTGGRAWGSGAARNSGSQPTRRSRQNPTVTPPLSGNDPRATRRMLDERQLLISGLDAPGARVRLSPVWWTGPVGGGAVWASLRRLERGGRRAAVVALSWPADGVLELRFPCPATAHFGQPLGAEHDQRDDEDDDELDWEIRRHVPGTTGWRPNGGGLPRNTGQRPARNAAQPP